MKKAVIAGATGAIGRALISVCISNGYEVLAVVHRESVRSAELERIEGCQVLYLNLDEYNRGLEEAKKAQLNVEGCELFFHLAWQGAFGKRRDDLDLQQVNIEAAVEAVRFAKRLGCKVFVGAGSQAEYGRTEGVLSPVTPAFPETGYGIAKLCAGQMTRLACEQLGIRHEWCRILSVYGPYDRDETLIGTAIKLMMEDKETEFTPCDQMWDYIYSEDAARALIMVAESGNDGEVYMIGSGEVQPLKQYVNTIALITHYSKEIGFGRRDYNPKQVMYLQADISSLHEQFGFKPMTTFEEGILKTVKWKESEM